MISNQVIQNSIDELRAITKVDLGVFDVEGLKVATTVDEIDISRDIIENFASSPADSQVVGGRHLLKILDDGEPAYILVAQGPSDDVYMVGKIAVSSIQNLIVAYKESVIGQPASRGYLQPRTEASYRSGMPQDYLFN